MQGRQSTSNSHSRIKSTQPATKTKKGAGAAPANSFRKLNSKKYATLLAEYLPRVIRTEAENERALKLFEPLFDKAVALEMEGKTLSPEESAIFDLLTKLIEDFEEDAYPVNEVTPRAMLQHCMDSRGLKQADLVPVFGSAGRVSDVLSGRRGISKVQAKRLAVYFNVTADLFI
jgi:HTH-type transcriptional regulator / antitoxin HigA